MMYEDLFARSRDQLGHTWRAGASLTLATLSPVMQIDNHHAPEWVASIIVLTEMARYSIGNYNYTFDTFAPTAVWAGAPITEGSIRRRFGWDSVLIGLQLGTMFCMARCIAKAEWFFWMYVAFLATDVLFLCFDRYAWPKAVLRLRHRESLSLLQPEPAVTDWPEKYAPRFWVVNNTITAMALVAVHLIFRSQGITDPAAYMFAAGTACIINSAIDIAGTRLHV